MNKEIPKTVLEMSSCELTMEIVLKNIYTSCDPHNLNKVPTSEIIEFIRPYIHEDLSALETLGKMLDPENKNVCIEEEQFYNVMNEWAKKITSHTEEDEDGEFNRTPSQMNVIDEKSLPYTQSTPRESFGQKLLSSQDLLNLSNVSNYNSSPTKQTKDNSTVGQEKTILEEEVKQLQYELNKVLGEMEMLKVQLAYSEEQNENLHDELKKFKTRLQSEHQVNGHLQENKSCLEDMKEEINLGKKRIEELNKKLTLYEKDNSHLNMYVQKLEKENSEIEDRCLQLNKMEQVLKKQLIDVKTELDMKDHELASVSKINEDLKLKIFEKNNEVDQLLNENELLDYKKQGLEKLITSRRYSLSSHYNTCLDEMSSFFSKGSTIPIYTSPLKHANQSFSFKNKSPPLLKKILSPISPNPHDPKSRMLYSMLQSSTPKGSNSLGMRKAFSLNAMSTRSLPNISCSERSNVVQDQGSDGDVALESLTPDLVFSNGPYESLQMELFQVDPQFDHKDKNGADLEFEEQIITLKSEVQTLQNKLQALVKENKILSIESNSSNDKIIDLENKIKTLKEKESLKDVILNKQEDKTVKDLEDKLRKKEKEIFDLKNRFDFESAYKRLESEYGRKIALLEELQQQCDDDRNTIINLEQYLNEAKAELQETKEKLKTREILSINIEHTANKVQAHVDGKKAVIGEIQKLNNDFRTKIEKLEKTLQDKNKQLGHLKDILKKEEEIKNKMWRDNQDLTTSLNILTSDYQKLLKELGENENVKKELKDEHNNILSKYNKETERNQELSHQISSHQKEYSEISSKYHEMNVKYHEQINENLKYREEFSYLKSETESIKDNQKMYKEELNKSIIEFQNCLQLLNSKLKDLEFENTMLKADLNIEKQKSVKIKDADYEDSGVKSDVSSDSSLTSYTYEKPSFPFKNRSFERQNLTIDRLKEKYESLDKTLLSEKSKNDILKERLNSKDKELQEASSRFSQEKNSLQTVINDLRNKIAQQEDYNKHLCSASSEKIKDLSLKLSQLDEMHKNTLLSLSQKESLLQRHFEMFEYNKITISNMSKTIQDLQLQQKSLATDLRAKEISLQKTAVDNQTFKHYAAKLKTQRLEMVSKLSYQETSLKNYESDLLKRDEELTSLSTFLSEQENRIQALTETVINYGQTISNLRLELSAKDTACVELRQELETVKEEMISKEKINKITESSEGFKSVETRDSQTQKEDEPIIDQISGFMDVISECCSDLNFAFTKFLEQWKSRIEMDPNFKNLPALQFCKSLDMDHVLSVIVNNVKAVILLLNILYSNPPPIMEAITQSHLDYPLNPKIEVNEPRVIKKFTLRPSKLHLKRSMSPDSPGIEMEPYLNENSQSERKDTSPDSQNCKTFELCGQGETCVHNDSKTNLSLLSFELQIQDAFPHLSDNFLDKLGLHENSPKVKLSKDETEKIFTTFAIQVALDSKDIKDRLQRQKEVCSQRHRKVIYLLKDISLRLRDHKCIGAIDPISPVFVMLEDIRFQMQEMMQAVGQLGVLTCENRMTKCWNLVTNYMAIIRQSSDCFKEQSSPNSRCSPGSVKSPTTPEKRKLPERCQNCDKLNASIKYDSEVKKCTGYRRCLSRFTYTLVWLFFIPLLVFFGVILVHWQCKMNTDYNICPLDDLIRFLTESIGDHPY